MKILVLFCDMLRSTLLKSANKNIPEDTAIDRWFKDLGGTFYSNCYTPAPDTARSTACMYTGLYPGDNGCQKRFHYPGYFLKPDVATIFDMLLDQDFKVLAYLLEPDREIGFLPSNIEDKIDIYDDLMTMAEKIHDCRQDENVFALYYLLDYHWAVDFAAGSYQSINQEGHRHLDNSFRSLFDIHPVQEFDYIFILSDHGCRMEIDDFSQDFLWLDDNRSKTVMFLHQQHDQDLHIDSNITSILDFYPTLQHILGVSPDRTVRDGKSLLTTSEDRYIVLEDYFYNRTELENYPEIWGVRTPHYLYLESVSGNRLWQWDDLNGYVVIEAVEEQILMDFREIIGNHACFYVLRKEETVALGRYRHYQDVYRRQRVYSDGEEIQKSVFNRGERSLRNLVHWEEMPDDNRWKNVMRSIRRCMKKALKI